MESIAGKRWRYKHTPINRLESGRRSHSETEIQRMILCMSCIQHATCPSLFIPDFTRHPARTPSDARDDHLGSRRPRHSRSMLDLALTMLHVSVVTFFSKHLHHHLLVLLHRTDRVLHTRGNPICYAQFFRNLVGKNYRRSSLY